MVPSYSALGNLLRILHEAIAGGQHSPQTVQNGLVIASVGLRITKISPRGPQKWHASCHMRLQKKDCWIGKKNLHYFLPFRSERDGDVMCISGCINFYALW